MPKISPAFTKMIKNKYAGAAILDGRRLIYDNFVLIMWRTEDETGWTCDPVEGFRDFRGFSGYSFDFRRFSTYFLGFVLSQKAFKANCKDRFWLINELERAERIWRRWSGRTRRFAPLALTQNLLPKNPLR